MGGVDKADRGRSGEGNVIGLLRALSRAWTGMGGLSGDCLGTGECGVKNVRSHERELCEDFAEIVIHEDIERQTGAI